MMGQIP